ncbi:Gfo/Idh/MocA family oxidoreductase [Listeria welshimeri]|uniref:Oxidoreductase, Gfo/Idh/MocA family n=1 Tax=Listeria welshimeri serovar 6b (strain ATCC 35897 / DSM 20650 / CCUG 15529 / CIP 8149 / NCTC 11857 / SLCC 5334 / V8) TaxID=386043 RepID=A0AMF0_LISW6|nr:Gfo/Idh/MocA family oxidoreductase [Listeria welshimeri]MBC1495332.1 Gfo/Idh/MocA family oxidoreductase [Listeria welshimeri]MBC1591186.1 Gfo/Idh/MocA family oxidoreductase [Listeria welshimeri]MBC1622743.1 Gfo/Idh/MocA family oxidoreductase [Listeria welshimeri]MBC1630985.1 Gfo/Idh/MocA family oxidoreductase [Listeria welshimeri]MBC1633668.1 Gfo/Idh/MocA family oxidoreductase [Listeria welshimeri]
MKKKVAIIGAGQVAEKVHAAYYKTRDELELVAVCDPSMERGEEFRVKNGFHKHYATAEEMFAVEKIDIVSICTPNRFHFDNVMLSLGHGAAVMCEKPPAMSASEAKAMWELADEKKVILAYDFHHRFSSEAQFLKQNVALLGEIYCVKATALRRSGVPGWGTFTNKEMQGGGPLIDMGIHMLDAAMFVLGFPKVKKVTAKSFQKIGTKKSMGTFGSWDPTKYTVEDSLFGFIELENGGLIELDTSFALHIKPENMLNVDFFGDLAGGSLYPAEIYTDNAGEFELLANKEEPDENKHENSMKAFVDSVLGEGEVELAGAEQGYRIQKIVESLYESAEKGESVSL